MAGTGMAATAGVPLGTRPGCRVVSRVPTARIPSVSRRTPAVETAGYRCQAPTGHLAARGFPAVETAGYRCLAPMGHLAARGLLACLHFKIAAKRG